MSRRSSDPRPDGCIHARQFRAPDPHVALRQRRVNLAYIRALTGRTAGTLRDRRTVWPPFAELRRISPARGHPSDQTPGPEIGSRHGIPSDSSPLNTGDPGRRPERRGAKREGRDRAGHRDRPDRAHPERIRDGDRPPKVHPPIRMSLRNLNEPRQRSGTRLLHTIRLCRRSPDESGQHAFHRPQVRQPAPRGFPERRSLRRSAAARAFRRKTRCRSQWPRHPRKDAFL